MLCFGICRFVNVMPRPQHRVRMIPQSFAFFTRFKSSWSLKAKPDKRKNFRIFLHFLCHSKCRWLNYKSAKFFWQVLFGIVISFDQNRLLMKPENSHHDEWKPVEKKMKRTLRWQYRLAKLMSTCFQISHTLNNSAMHWECFLAAFVSSKELFFHSLKEHSPMCSTQHRVQWRFI